MWANLVVRSGSGANPPALPGLANFTASLLGRSLFRILTVNPGFDAHGVVALNVSLPAASYTTDERVASFYAALQAALEERLGPRTISIVDEIPLTGDRGRSVVSVRAAEPGREAVVRAASAGYFDVMRIPVVAGRSFDRGDNASAPLRAVISRSMAERLFAFEPAVGRPSRATSTGTGTPSSA